MHTLSVSILLGTAYGAFVQAEREAHSSASALVPGAAPVPAARGIARGPDAVMQLLGADGRPIGSSAPAPAPAGGGLLGVNSNTDAGEADSGIAAVGSEEIPDFDPNAPDPLAAPRPKYDLAGATGRPDEYVWGAIAPADAAELPDWAAHMKAKGAARMLGLFSAEQAGARSPDGTPAGYMNALVEAGFPANGVGLLDPRAPGSRDFVLSMMQDAKAAREKLVLHCADGTALTGPALADWVLTDYIGGYNYLEAVDLLRSRERLAGVGREVSDKTLESWITEGHM